jgi:ubiquinone/menaquinone biosynthesis C-methylase UbiE
MSNFGDQYQRPMGRLGKLVATMMNQHHEDLTLWGLAKVTIDSHYVILDVGCGGGKTITRLSQLTPHGKVYGIDYSVDMVKFSKKINKLLIAQNRVEIIEGSVEKISFEDNFFDLVTAIETYYFWSNLLVAFKEIHRVLKPGGRLLLVNELLYGVTSVKIVEETHVKLFALKEIQSLLQLAGFYPVQVFTKAESEWNLIIAQKTAQKPIM